MSVDEAAFGIYRVACAQITDLIHEITVERGLDPRDFVLHAFGGTCGLLCGVFGQELSVRRVVVPYTASVNCAFGLVAADIVHEYTVTKVLPEVSQELREIAKALDAGTWISAVPEISVPPRSTRCRERRAPAGPD